MDLAVFTTNLSVITNLQEKLKDESITVFTSKDEVDVYISNNPENIIIVDYDSVSHDLNQYLQSNNLPNSVVVIEREPNITTGFMLISKGIRAYGNTNMLFIHLNQLLRTVSAGKTWTYPELTAYLVKRASNKTDYSEHELLKRLSPKEKDVALQILNGLNNRAIAENLDITERTVKAHISAILSKLHINDRISLVLLLK